MQWLGLTILPLAVFLELSRAVSQSFGVRQMLVMLVFGAALFWLGRLLEGYSRLDV
jgi:hypothetical protein